NARHEDIAGRVRPNGIFALGNEPRAELARILLRAAIAGDVPYERALILRCDQERVARQAGSHVAFHIEHQDAIAACDSGEDQIKHGLRLAGADTAPNEPVPCLALAADSEAWQDLEAGTGQPAFQFRGLREGAPRCGASQQLATTQDTS